MERCQSDVALNAIIDEPAMCALLYNNIFLYNPPVLKLKTQVLTSFIYFSHTLSAFQMQNYIWDFLLKIFF